MSAASATKAPPASLSQPIESLNGVGPARAREFHHLGVATLGDLLEYFPRTYQYESAEKPISQIVRDQIDDGLLERFAFNSRDDGESELFSQRLRVPGATREPDQQYQHQGYR